MQPCSAQGIEQNTVRLGAVRPQTTTSWQCYANNGKCSSFLIHRGDSIQIAGASGGWTCGYVTSDDGAGPEWVRTGDLALVQAVANPPLSAWLGTWKGGEDVVHIKPIPGRAGWLDLDGSAVWNGLAGNQHLGEIHGRAAPAGDKLHYTEGAGESACVVDLTLIGNYLLASDNQRCGGLNARFGGVWRRVQK